MIVQLYTKNIVYLEVPDKFNVYVNLLLLLTMSALKCFKF